MYICVVFLLKQYFGVVMSMKEFHSVFESDESEEKKSSSNTKINMLDILKGLYNNKITANIESDLTLTKTGNSGYIKANNLSIINLPPSIVDIFFKGNIPFDCQSDIGRQI